LNSDDLSKEAGYAMAGRAALQDACGLQFCPLYDGFVDTKAFSAQWVGVCSSTKYGFVAHFPLAPCQQIRRPWHLQVLPQVYL
jgi:hypothetical protein